jgi:very-short-patch-repair endonuclease
VKIIWDAISSALAFPKRVKRKLKRKPISSRGRFVVKDNPLKSYRQRYPSEQLRQWAEQRKAEQLSKEWPAEMAFKGILDRLEIYYQRQHIFYRTQGFILADFYIPARKLVFELDGITHARQINYDAGRDKWLLNTWGVITKRVPNMLALRNPVACEKLVRAELRL